MDNNWIELYSIEDNNENGIIEEDDIVTDDYVGFISTQLQPGGIITFDVTSVLEHDLFNPSQSNFSGFVLKCEVCNDIEFYDHTDSENAPRLSIDSNGGTASIPTLSEWGLIIFMTLISGISVVMLYRRREI